MAAGDTAIAVAAEAPLQGSEKRLLRGGRRDLLECRGGHVTTSRRGRLELFDRHYGNSVSLNNSPLDAKEIDRAAFGQGHVGLFPVGTLAEVAADALHLAGDQHGIDVLDLDAEGRITSYNVCYTKLLRICDSRRGDGRREDSGCTP